jgi:hypothetical protein
MRFKQCLCVKADLGDGDLATPPTSNPAPTKGMSSGSASVVIPSRRRSPCDR